MSKNNILIPLLLLAAIAPCSGCGNDTEEFDPPGGGGGDNNGEKTEVVYHQRAKEMLDAVNALYRINPTDNASLYREELGGTAYSFAWPYDGMISGIAALLQLGYNVHYAAMVDNYEKYLRHSSPASSLPGYGSSTDGATGSGTRFYDDNSIIGIELVEAYQLTKQQRYLDRATVVYNFLRAAVDDTMGKALWWNEDQKNQPGVGDSNKAACANGYATRFLLNYYHICPFQEKAHVLELARTLYNWLKTNLRDPSDKTYWNDKNANGNINKTKWTYNSGVMVQNGVLLYQITGSQTDLDDAKATATGAYNYFVKPRGSLPLAYPDHDPWFNAKLLGAYIDLAPYFETAKSYIDTYISFIDYGYEHARLANGLFYEDWTGRQQGRYTNLLQQAAVIESYGLIALYKQEKK